MPSKADLAWKFSEQTGKTARYINVKRVFCSKSYLSRKTERMREHVDKECIEVSAEARNEMHALQASVIAMEAPSTDDDKSRSDGFGDSDKGTA